MLKLNYGQLLLLCFRWGIGFFLLNCQCRCYIDHILAVPLLLQKKTEIKCVHKRKFHNIMHAEPKLANFVERTKQALYDWCCFPNLIECFVFRGA